MSTWPAPSPRLLVPPFSVTTTLDSPPAAGTGAPARRPPATISSIEAETTPGIEPDRGPDKGIAHRLSDVGGLLARFVALFWCWSVLWLTLWSVAPALAGWTPTVVATGSMSPSLRPGTVVQVDRDADLDALLPGAIITFDSPAVENMRVTHRITGVNHIDGVLTGFRTKGDANSTADSTIVPVDNVEGVVRLVIPGAGLPNVWRANGQWILLGLFVVFTVGAGLLALETIWRFVSSRDGHDDEGSRRSRRRRAVGVAVAATTLVGTSSTSAALSGTTGSAVNGFGMTAQWHVDAIDRAGPVAHWRLGELNGTPGTVVYTDDFESFSGYNTIGSGQFVTSTAQARSGSRSGLKTGNNDPNGGWRALPATITSSFEFEVWVYRPAGFGGGAIDRLGLEDASFNGYTVRVDHGSNTINIDRRTAGTASRLTSNVSFNPPENTWYRLQLVRAGPDLTLNIYDGSAALLATTSATDASTVSFDRMTVRGGWDYHVDDLRITQTFPASVAADRVGTVDGQYVGTPTLGAGGLVTNNSDSAVDFDGLDDIVTLGDSALINLTARGQRTIELWVEPDTTTGRQLIYEEGGSTNGINISLDGEVLYGHAWSQSSGWSNALITTGVITAGTRRHVALVLDATGSRTLELFVDGVSVDTDSKTDANVWAAHGDDGAIGGLNGSSRMHDGNISGGGYLFDGTIDEVVLYNTALGAAVIAGHQAAGN